MDPHSPLSFSVDCAALAFPSPHSCPRLSFSVRPGPLLLHKPIVHTHLWSDAHQTANVPEPERFPRWTRAQPCSQSRDSPAGLHQPASHSPRGSQALPIHLQSLRPSSEISLYECSSPSCEALPTRLSDTHRPTPSVSPHTPLPQPTPSSCYRIPEEDRQSQLCSCPSCSGQLRPLSCQRAF